MTKIKSKFVCVGATKDEYNNENVTFLAVTTGSEENTQWSKFTPSGQLTMCITQEGAVGFFKQGKEYYLTLEEA